MSFTLFEPGLRAFFNGRDVEQILRVRAEEVVRQADINAAGEIIGIESGQLSLGIRYEIGPGPDGIEAVVGTDANKDGFYYPTYWDLNGRPWLFSALQSVLPNATRSRSL